MTIKKGFLPDDQVYSRIYLIRDQKVLLDQDLATMYGVSTKVFNQAVKRNIERFPADFMFQLTDNEFINLRSQIVTSSSDSIKSGWGGRRYKPFVFTEQGVAMLAGILPSPIAIAINIQILRVFVKMRKMISEYKELLDKIESLEATQLDQDVRIEEIYNTIKQLLETVYKERSPLGYIQSEKPDQN